jgi:outer membrane lipoprotein-sorting protein
MRSMLLLLAILVIVLSGCTQKLSDKLNGKWQSDLMTVSIDLKSGTYNGVAMGEPFKHKVKVKEETDMYVILIVDENQITAQFNGDDRVTLTKEGGIPIAFTRAKQ